MANGRLRNLLAMVSGVLDGGARAQEAERRRELRGLTFEEGRAIPQHIAIIMDGNGRWAASRHLPRSLGHRAGVELLHRTVELCNYYPIPMFTVYSFSSRNSGPPQ